MATKQEILQSLLQDRDKLSPGKQRIIDSLLKEPEFSGLTPTLQPQQTEQPTPIVQQPSISFRGLPEDQGRLTPEETTLSELFPGSQEPTTDAFTQAVGLSKGTGEFLEKSGQRTAEILGEAGFPKTGVAIGAFGVGAGAILPESKLELGLEVITLGGAKAVGGAISLAKTPTARKFIAQLVKVSSAVPERTVLAVLKKPKILSGTESVAQATLKYVKSLSRGKEKIVSASEFIAKRKKVPIPKDADFEKLLGESLEKLRAGTATPQDALNAHQSIGRILGSKEFRKTADLREILAAKEEVLLLLDKAFPGFKKANNAVREAYIRQEFDSLLPLGKNLSPNALRTLIAVSAIASGANDLFQGDPKQAAIKIGLALSVSPKVAGLLIKLGSKLGPLGRDVGLGGLFGAKGAKAAKEAGESAVKRTKALIKSERGALDIFPKKGVDPTAAQGKKIRETLSELGKSTKGLSDDVLKESNKELREILARTREQLRKK